MADTETQARRVKPEEQPAPDWRTAPAGPDPVRLSEPVTPARAGRHWRIIPVLITLATIAIAVPLGWAMWDAYMGAPWTRDGTVRAYVVTMAPEVAGRIVELPIVDNQFVRKGDLLVTIDPTNFRIAVSLGEAAVQQAEANAQNAQREAERRLKLTTLAVTVEDQQTHQPTRSRPKPSISKPWPTWTRRGSTSSARRSALR